MTKPILEGEIEPKAAEFSLSKNPDDDFLESEAPQYITFSGADIIIFLDGKALYTCAAARWEEDLHSGEVKGTLAFTLFNDAGKEIREKLLAKPYDAIVFKMTNEYGAEASYRLVGPKFVRRTGGASMDDIVLEDTYYFIADSFEYDS